MAHIPLRDSKSPDCVPSAAIHSARNPAPGPECSSRMRDAAPKRNLQLASSTALGFHLNFTARIAANPDNSDRKEGVVLSWDHPYLSQSLGGNQPGPTGQRQPGPGVTSGWPGPYTTPNTPPGAQLLLPQLLSGPGSGPSGLVKGYLRQP